MRSAPADLLDTMVSALPDDSASVPAALAAGAMRLYHTVVRGTGGREDALSLLAADALLTHAFQAQVEIDPTGIPRLADDWGSSGALGRLAEVL